MIPSDHPPADQFFEHGARADSRHTKSLKNLSSTVMCPPQNIGVNEFYIQVFNIEFSRQEYVSFSHRGPLVSVREYDLGFFQGSV